MLMMIGYSPQRRGGGDHHFPVKQAVCDAFCCNPQSCIFAQSVVKIQLIMRLDGWLPGYLSTAPVFVRSLPPCVFVCVLLLLVLVMVMIFILRGKCDCYLHVFFPFMILSRCPSMFNIP